MLFDFYRMLFGDAANFELFSHFNEIDQILIVDMYLTHVHEIQNCSQYLTLDAIDEKHRMWTWIFLRMHK